MDIIENPDLQKSRTESLNPNGGSSGVDRLAGSVLSGVFDRTDPETPASPPAAAAASAQSILEKFESKKIKAAENLNVAAGEVEALPFDLSQLESEGIFMNIDTHGFGALTRQLDWKTLGVKLPENRTILIAPPRAGLLPDKYRRKLMRGAAQAHSALKKYSFRFTLCETVFGTSDYKWIPWSAFESFEEDYRRSCATLAEAKAEVLADYEEILRSLRASFRELAEDSARRLENTLDEPFDRGEFVARVVAGALSMVPTREAIRDGLLIRMKPKVIILGSEMAAEQRLQREIGLEKAKADAEYRAVHLELETKREIERRKMSDFESERRREREVKERIRRMKIEAAKREAEEAVSPVKEGLDQITSKIAQAAAEMAEKLRSADFVPGALAKRARQMCEWYRLMNFTDDKSLEEVLGTLERAAGRRAKSRSPEEIKSALTDVLRATSVQSKKLLDEDRLTNLEI
jgi:hypothetical protein